MYNRIKDPDVKSAIETLSIEFENKEDEVKDLESECQDLQDKVDSLEAENAALEAKVEELEEALAEAYLTSKAESEPCNESSVSPTSTED